MLLRPLGFGSVVSTFLLLFYLRQYQHVPDLFRKSTADDTLEPVNAADRSTIPVETTPAVEAYSTELLASNATLRVSLMLKIRLAITHIS